MLYAFSSWKITSSFWEHLELQLILHCKAQCWQSFLCWGITVSLQIDKLEENGYNGVVNDWPLVFRKLHWKKINVGFLACDLLTWNDFEKTSTFSFIITNIQNCGDKRLRWHRCSINQHPNQAHKSSPTEYSFVYLYQLCYFSCAEKFLVFSTCVWLIFLKELTAEQKIASGWSIVFPWT